LEGDKLYIKGNAPTQEAKDRVWDEIKMITPAYGEDLICDIDAPIRATPPREVLHGHAEEESDKPLAEVQEYVVKPGDTLSKISQLFYGDASRYMEIFEANSDVLMDPNKIKPGQKLVIPPKG
jgi:nucleoid-associated protein YgaU